MIAARDSRLLSRDGLADRARIQRLEFDKPSYADAAAAADASPGYSTRTGSHAERRARTRSTRPVWAAALPPSAPDTVITDNQYGQQTAWINSDDADHSDPVTRLSAALGVVGRPDAVVAICASGRKVTIRGDPGATPFPAGHPVVVFTRASRMA